MIRLSAIRYRETLYSGHSRPCIIEGETIEGERHEVVVKLRESVHGKINGLACELIASRLASAAGLDVPQPFIVEITPEFAESVPDNDARLRFHANIGQHFGSALVTPQTHAVPFDRGLPPGLVDPAAAVIAFDALVANDDRHFKKANYVIRGSKIMVIDHERAIPGARREIRAEPWTPLGLEFIQRHVFFPGVRGELADWPGIATRWEAITEEQLRSFARSIPDEWDADGVAARLETYLFAMLENTPTVFRSLEILLR